MFQRLLENRINENNSYKHNLEYNKFRLEFLFSIKKKVTFEADSLGLRIAYT